MLQGFLGLGKQRGWADWMGACLPLHFVENLCLYVLAEQISSTGHLGEELKHLRQL